MAWRVADLAARLGLSYQGDGSRVVTRVASLEGASRDCLSFVARAAMLAALERTQAGAVIVAPEHAARVATAALLAKNPYAAYARAAQLLHPQASAPSGTDPTAVVAASAEVAECAYVGPYAVVESGARIERGAVIEAGAYVGRDTRIGACTRMGPRTVVRHECSIGSRCRLQSGTVIGADGFGFARDGEEWVRIPQLGRVLIGDDVDVGANTTIDRGALDDTVIGDGVVMDNLIQIAHNVRVGDYTAMAGCVGVAGSAVIGRRCAIGGGVGILGHLEIADDVQVTAMSLVHKSITLPGTYSSGLPIEANTEWRRNAARFRNLDGMARRLNRVEALVGGRGGGGGGWEDDQA